MCASTDNLRGPKKTVFFNIRLDPEMHAALTALAEAHERTIAGEIRAALKDYLREADRTEAAA